MISFRKFIQEAIKFTKVPMGVRGGMQHKDKSIKKGDKVTLKPDDHEYPNKTGTVASKPVIDKRYGKNSVILKIKLKGVSKPIERYSHQLVGLDTKRSHKFNTKTPAYRGNPSKGSHYAD